MKKSEPPSKKLWGAEWHPAVCVVVGLFPKQCVHFCAEHNVFSFWAFLTDAAAVEVGVKVSVVPHKAVAEVSKIGNL